MSGDPNTNTNTEQATVTLPDADTELDALRSAISEAVDAGHSVFDTATEPAADTKPDDATTEPSAPTEPAAPPPAAATAPKADDTDPADTLPDSKPRPDDWRTMREIHKRDKDTIADLNKRLAALESGRSNTAAAEVPPQITAPQPAPAASVPTEYAPEFVFDALARFQNGDVTDARVKSEAEQAIMQMSPAQVADVILKARKNEFGDRSDTVLELARDWQPIVVGQWDRVQAQRAADARATATRNAAWAEVFKEMPGLLKKGTPEYEAQYAQFSKANEELAQVVPGLSNIPHWPKLVADFATISARANERDQVVAKVAALEKENQQLKLRLGVRSTPGATERPTATATAEPDLREELRQAFRAAGISQA